MARIILSGWKSPFNKVGLNRLLRAKAGLSLGEAKHIVDNVLEGIEVPIDVDSRKLADELRNEATGLGAVCKVVDEPSEVAPRHARN
jgi:ribosomal protein L7/L12